MTASLLLRVACYLNVAFSISLAQIQVTPYNTDGAEPQVMDAGVSVSSAEQRDACGSLYRTSRLAVHQSTAASCSNS